jgi:aspartate/methionine/tyrosine aminotransferase
MTEVATHVADRLANIELSLIRQINALATPLSANLGIGEPNLEPDETLRAFARRAATTSWHYSANTGSLSLRKKLCANTTFDPATECCVTAGTQEALFAIFQAYVNPGDEVLVPNPGFSSYATVARICSATPVPYDLEPPSWTLDVSRIRFTPKTKLVVVNSPSNPLGAVLPRETLEAIARMAEERGLLVVSDEIYREIWYDAPPASMTAMSSNVIIVNGMSKSHGMTGLRLGWILASAAILKPVVTAHQYIATCASVFSQALTEVIFDAPEWNASWLDGVRQQFRAQRDAALYSISHELEAEIEPPAGAFYAFVPVPSRDTLSFAKSLATDAAVLVIPGVAFGSAGEGFIRISYAAPVEQIATGIERVGRWLRANGK